MGTLPSCTVVKPWLSRVCCSRLLPRRRQGAKALHCVCCAHQPRGPCHLAAAAERGALSLALVQPGRWGQGGHALAPPRKCSLPCACVRPCAAPFSHPYIACSAQLCFTAPARASVLIAELQAANAPLHPVVQLALQTPPNRSVVLAAIAGSAGGSGSAAQSSAAAKPVAAMHAAGPVP